jgi:cellulose biosynthesis protein BcsQ
MRAQPQTRSDARTIAMWGPHGSSGKSTIAINLAESLSNSGFQVLLVDADRENPSLAIMLGLDRPTQDFTAAKELESADRAPGGFLPQIFRVACGSHHFHLLSGISPTAQWSELGVEEVQYLMQQMEQYDRIVFDLSSSLDSPGTRKPGAPNRNQLTRFLISAVDQLVAIGRADFLGVHRLVAQLLSVKKLRKDKPTKVVFNLVATRPSPVEALDAFESLARERISATITRDDRTVSSALKHGKTARMTRRSAKFVSDVDALARQLLTP